MDKLRAGFSMIKMVGPTVQEAISNAREKVEEFKSIYHFLETIDRRKANRRVIKMLIDSGAFDKVFSKEEAKIWKLHFDELYDTINSKKKHEEFIEEKTKTLKEDWEVGYENIVLAQQEALNFKISNDIYGSYRKLINFIKTHLKIKDIKDIDDSLKDDKERLYAAQATTIKFGYSERAKKAATGKAGTADALGGIYGNIDDGTSYTMVIYRPELYKRKKEQIEKIKGEVAIFKANHPQARKTNIWVNDFVRLKDISRGRPGWLKIKALEDKDPPDTREFDETVRACKRCNLRDGCRAPVPPSIGRCNIMILGEAPGRDEDREGKGFVGRSGIELWKELRRVGIEREHCIVANCVACMPPDGKKIPNVTYIPRCPWPKFTIETFKPRFILATGNAALYYFKRLKSGITSFNGKTEWDNRSAAWVTYCMHPASVLYDPNNRTMFRGAIESFARVISNFS